MTITPTSTTASATASTGPTSSQLAAARQKAAVEKAAQQNPVAGFYVDSGRLASLAALAASPESSTYMSLYGTPDGLGATIMGVDVPNFEGTLDALIKVSRHSLGRIPAERLKLQEAASKLNALVARAEHDLTENAHKLIRRKAGGRESVALHLLALRIGQLSALSNPLNLSNSTLRDASKMTVVVIAGSAVAPFDADLQTRNEAELDLLSNVADLRDVIAAETGLNPVNIGFAKNPTRVSVAGQVGVSSRYSFTVSDQASLAAVVDKLEGMGQLSILDPLITSPEVLHLNAAD